MVLWFGSMWLGSRSRDGECMVGWDWKFGSLSIVALIFWGSIVTVTRSVFKTYVSSRTDFVLCYLLTVEVVGVWCYILGHTGIVFRNMLGDWS